MSSFENILKKDEVTMERRNPQEISCQTLPAMEILFAEFLGDRKRMDYRYYLKQGDTKYMENVLQYQLRASKRNLLIIKLKMNIHTLVEPSRMNLSELATG